MPSPTTPDIVHVMCQMRGRDKTTRIDRSHSLRMHVLLDTPIDNLERALETYERLLLAPRRALLRRHSGRASVARPGQPSFRWVTNNAGLVRPVLDMYGPEAFDALYSWALRPDEVNAYNAYFDEGAPGADGLQQWDLSADEADPLQGLVGADFSAHICVVPLTPQNAKPFSLVLIPGGDSVRYRESVTRHAETDDGILRFVGADVDLCAAALAHALNLWPHRPHGVRCVSVFGSNLPF